jgi:hypothetical protein
MTSEFDERTVARVKEHPLPTVATVKQLYASAFRCAKPECLRPLYKTNDDTGEFVLNSRIAHIHARRAGGPRWIEMTSEENRGASNLVLLCIEHSYEVDDFPVQFPAEMLRQWKKAQLGEYEHVQRGWPLSDAEAGQAIGASSQAVEHQHADAVLGAVRAVEKFTLAAHHARRVPAAQASNWLAIRARARRTTFYDQDGNALHAEPSSSETRQRRTALELALAQACDDLIPVADDVKVELAAARASRTTIAPWVSWVSRAVDDVIAVSGTWPGPPALEDDDRLATVLEKLAEARDALSAVWRGEEAPSPPLEPQPEPAVVEHDPVEEHLELLERARPYARVDHRPYDPALRAELAEAASAAAGIPPVPSALILGLRTTCRLAAAVAANAEDDELAVLTDQDATRRPLSAAFRLLAESAQSAEKRGRLIPQERAEAALLALWNSVDWTDSGSWDPEDLNLLSVFWIGAQITSHEAVKEKLTNAIKQQPNILLPLITAAAGWVEVVDSETHDVRDRRRRHGRLPPWFPVLAVEEAAVPGASVAVDDFGETASDDAESLLAQVLWAAKHERA